MNIHGYLVSAIRERQLCSMIPLNEDVTLAGIYIR